MKISKLEHACLILDNNTSRLVIDPGGFTKLPKDLSGINCVVVTEEHMDHFNLENLQAILAKNPDAQIISTEKVKNDLEVENIRCKAVSSDNEITVGGYRLKFKQADHATTYGQSPCKVLTITVDDFLYYPSDSFTTTGQEIEVLALPTSGPWHKISEAIELANNVKSRKILATHNGLYNEIGDGIANRFIASNLADSDRQYIFLAVGETKEF